MHKYLYPRLSIQQFIQFYIWGSWFVTGGNYMTKVLGFSGREVGAVYATTAIAATISPFILGVLADRLFSSEKLLSVLHLIGGILLFAVSMVESFGLFYPLILAYVLCYLPTFSLTNALCFHHVDDAKRDFPRVRVWGTISWILAGLFVGFSNLEDSVIPFRIAAVCSFILSVYSLTLPATPPKGAGTSLLSTLSDPRLKDLVKDKSFVLLMISVAVICIPTSYYYSFVNTFLNEVGVSHAAAKMSLGQVTEILFMVTLPLLFAKMRLKYIMFIGLLFWGLRYGMFMWGLQLNSELIILLGLGVHGIAYIFSTLTAQIYLDTKVPPEIRGTAQGFYSLITLGLMAFVGSTIAGESVSYFTLDNGNHDWLSIWIFPFSVGTVMAFIFLLGFKGKTKV